MALLVVAGCLAHGCVATGVPESMLEPVPPMDELPAELLAELAMMEEGHPTMRRLLAEVWPVGLNSRHPLYHPFSHSLSHSHSHSLSRSLALTHSLALDSSLRICALETPLHPTCPLRRP